MTNSSDKLNTIIEQIILNTAKQNFVAEHRGDPEYPKLNAKIDMAIAQARLQIFEWAMECVGPDDDHTYMERKDRATAPVRTRNQLRHEIIAKLTEKHNG